ncbi:MAG: glycosyltransferase family 2 protein [Candidatus Paceibacterota bacterium]
MKNNTENKVTIITPSFNQGHFIEETLLSIKNQDYPKIEHIVIDGGSTDNTVDVLKKYEKKYNLRWLSEPDEGQSDAINKGVKMADGDIIGWLNSDDVYLFIDSISNIVKTFKEDESADIIFGNLAFINKKNEILRIYNYQKFNYSKLIKYRYNLGQPSVFFRKKILKENQINEALDYAMDYDLWLRLGKKYNFKHLNKAIAGFRVYSEAKSGSANDEKFRKERSKILEKINSTEENRIYIKILDKLSRGINGRVIGLFNLISHKYISKNSFAFNGKYFNFPLDIKNQLLGKIKE